MKSFLLPWFQIPLFICMSFSLRGMVISPELVDSLSAGGFGWVTDLTARDPTMIFPIAIGMSNFLNVEVRADFPHQGADYRQLQSLTQPCSPAQFHVYARQTVIAPEGASKHILGHFICHHPNCGASSNGKQCSTEQKAHSVNRFLTSDYQQALSLYWTTSSLYSVAQNVLFRVPTVRKALKLPIVNKPSNEPK